MEAPPQAPVITTTTADSISSPHSSFDSTSTTQQQQKLRLMCSYNGHIVPRPHDKSLCYIGGDTRIIVIDRSTTCLSSLHDRLSKTLLNNQPFILKYQLPNEDLDSLISVATDEDLENMLEEYDRLNNNSTCKVNRNKGRLRLFLFPKIVGNSVEQMLVETASTKSDDWFLDALNGKRNNLSGGSDLGFSETSSVNCLLGLDDDFGTKTTTVLAAASVPDSPMVPEATNSSFGSTSSSPSIVAGVNLAPIKVRVEEGNAKLGVEEQFQQQVSIGNVATNVHLQKQEEGFVVSNVQVGGEYANRGFMEDERLDHGGGYRLVQQTQPQVQQVVTVAQLKQQNSVYDMPSPDSVSSEGSARNPLSRQGQTVYQEQYVQMQSGNVPITATQVDLKNADQNIRTKVQMQQPQIQESGYVLQQSHYDQSHPQLHHPQQQYIHPGTQYIPAGAVPITQYYQMYPPRQQSMHEQQYPVFFMPPRQPQAYNVPMQQQQQQQQQPNYGELPANAHSSQPQTPPSATITPTSGYTQGRVAPSSNPEMQAGVYRTAAPQYVGLPQFHHPSQSMAQSTAGNAPYANYEFADPPQGQIYYTHAMPPSQMAAQYQTMTSGPMIVSTEAPAQLPAEIMKQQVRAAQP